MTTRSEGSVLANAEVDGVGPSQSYIPVGRQVSTYILVLSLTSAILLGLVTSVIVRAAQVTGAWMLPEEMGKAQNVDPRIVAEPFNLRFWAALKIPRIKHDQPEIVSIGSSRGMEVRAALFRPYTFYNASLTAWTVGQEIQMVDQILRVAKPRIIIIGLDYFMFTDQYANEMVANRTMRFNNGIRFRYESTLNLVREFFNVPPVLKMAVRAWQDGNIPYQVGPFKLLGIDAMRGVTGFRADGSMLMPAATYEQSHYKIERNEGLIEAAPGGPAMAERQLKDLSKIAELAKAHNVKLVAIQFPILKKTVDYLDNDEKYRYYAGLWRDFESPAMAKRLSDLGIEFFDLGRSPMGAVDQYFMDAAHVTEFGMSFAMSHLLEEKRFVDLFPAIDPARVATERSEAASRGNLYEIYDEAR